MSALLRSTCSLGGKYTLNPNAVLAPFADIHCFFSKLPVTTAGVLTCTQPMKQNWMATENANFDTSLPPKTELNTHIHIPMSKASFFQTTFNRYYPISGS